MPKLRAAGAKRSPAQPSPLQSSQNSEVQGLSLRMVLVVGSFTACWYYTSSKNAVATQQLVQEYRRLGAENDVHEKVDDFSPFPIVAVLTALQLLVGLCISWPLHYLLASKDGKNNLDSNDTVGPKRVRLLLVGNLHFLGCLFTNLGFAYGSASLVQVVKLMEPIETLFLTALINVFFIRRDHGITSTKFLSIVVIIFGTALLLMRKGMKQQANFLSVAFALCSGFAMASRNVVQKSAHKRSEKGKANNLSHQGGVPWKQAAVNGMFNFLSITAMAVIPASIFLGKAEIMGSNQIDGSVVMWMLRSAGQLGAQAIIFHGLYNIASISVLTLISAQSHSLLNVGKRICNVLVAALVFHEPVGPIGILGLGIAAIGGALYSNAPATLAILSWNKVVCSKGSKLMLLVSLLSIFCMNTNEGRLKKLIAQSSSSQVSLFVDTSSAEDRSNAPSTFVVWMYPFPPPVGMMTIQSADEILICAYSNACQEYKDHSKINLRSLTQNTYFHNYIRDHAYHKVRHMNDFPHHIQAITMMTLLQTRPGSCVRTLGGDAKFCNDKQFSTYDPYESVHLNSTHFPLPFIDTGEVSLAPHTAENFAMWGDGDIPGLGSRYNSGEDVQSYAGAAWLPFISEIRKKKEALLNYTGYYIGNALLGLDESLKFGEADLQNSKKISLLSIYFSSQESVKNMENYLRHYTETVEPFGSRSKLTNRLLRSFKIKSYFSACLTLTTNMQGAVLDDQAPSQILNRILKPNARALPQEKTMVLMVDVQNERAVPEDVRKRAIHLRADIDAKYPDHWKKMGRYGYSYKLLSLYANQAKVIITSRIHVGLPAAAMGVPVIFVSTANGWLPGGIQKVGRVEGLLDVFHRVEPESGKNWTFDNLTGAVPPNPGNHLADRYRASFWHRLKKTHFYYDTARLFGMVPLQRLGRSNVDINVQDTFHFLLNRNELNWQTQRAIEHIFFFHPNAQVFVHSNDIIPSDLEIFVESGYSLVVQQYDVDSLKRDAFANAPFKGMVDNRIMMPFLLLRKFGGGVYLSKNTIVYKEIPMILGHGMVLEEDGAAAMMYFDEHSIDKFAMNLRNEEATSWKVPVLSRNDTLKCVEDKAWALEGLDDSLAVSLHPSTYASVNVIKIDSVCYKVIEEPCIYLDEIHWEF
mmetsp:Transcript_33613/g.49393  ORF Transcript_33613/g.49393 Transcript_33613/m.49393 type:complete len:1148 (-) Transcript_33613:125-3568(-)|eukprot:CAMPEP_0195525150 /NCGR_PEP_ID=MMETSP0794_2-20130614/25421_1 /TAXON_ID=515487 /ORGANISM="Stephanopyxis turris, Strain CCMP 815" /LENGTH=1147 /DNA_ID=CAMNT_0040655533 /DNA_START=97 /DNA_END=3540 /DNA_ORIENTATION=+